MGRVVVIDGPAGSGKSTTAIALAKKLGFTYLDTGAMYRAVTLQAILSGIANNINDNTIKDILKTVSLILKPNSNGLDIYLGDDNVSAKIRSDRVEALVSQVAAIPAVREFMHVRQRAFAGDFDMVAEGRDLGTVVFPDADVKIFLVADLEERARRRMIQKNASEAQLSRFLDNLKNRDEIDSGRKHSPLKKADDAIEIDTSNLTFNEQVDKIYQICLEKLK